jgi:hypothetical protein
MGDLAVKPYKMACLVFAALAVMAAFFIAYEATSTAMESGLHWLVPAIFSCAVSIVFGYVSTEEE